MKTLKVNTRRQTEICMPSKRIRLDKAETDSVDFLGAKHSSTDIDIVHKTSNEKPNDIFGINNPQEKLTDEYKQQHHIKDEHVIYCAHCKGIFFSENNMKTHLIEKHEETRNLNCTKFNKLFKTILEKYNYTIDTHGPF